MTSGKYERTVEWKNKVYKNPIRNKKIAEALKGRKLSKEHTENSRKARTIGYYDKGYIRYGRRGVFEVTIAAGLPKLGPCICPILLCTVYKKNLNISNRESYS